MSSVSWSQGTVNEPILCEM